QEKNVVVAQDEVSIYGTCRDSGHQLVGNVCLRVSDLLRVIAATVFVDQVPIVRDVNDVITEPVFLVADDDEVYLFLEVGFPSTEGVFELLSCCLRLEVRDD